MEVVDILSTVPPYHLRRMNVDAIDVGGWVSGIRHDTCGGWITSIQSRADLGVCGCKVSTVRTTLVMVTCNNTIQ